MDDDWIELMDAATRLDRHPTQVRKLAAAGDLVGRRIGPEGRGGRWLVSAASVAALTAQWAANPPRRGRPAASAPSALALAKRRSRERHHAVRKDVP